MPLTRNFEQAAPSPSGSPPFGPSQPPVPSRHPGGSSNEGARSRRTRAVAWSALGLGTLLSVAAVHGRWDLALAAWLFPILLLRFSRSSRLVVVPFAIWGSAAITQLAMLVKAGLPVLTPLSALCVVLAAVQTVPFVLDRMLATRIRRPLLASLVFPAAVVVAEFVLATVTPVGNAMGTYAATQHEALPLIQVASVTGGYGVTFLMTWFAAVAAWVWEQRARWRRARTVVLTYAVVLAIVLVGGGLRLAFFTPSTDTIRVAGVSASRSVSAEAEEPFGTYDTYAEAAAAEPDDVRRSFEAINTDLLGSTEREARAGARIVAWSEAAAPILDADRSAFLRRIGEVAKRSGIYVVAGVFVVTDEAPYSRNESVLVTPEGQVAWTFEKARPVPGMDTTLPGDGNVPTFDTPMGRLAGVICFDSMFPNIARQGHGADLMFVSSNDWPEFGRTHTEKNALPAVENGYTIVRPDSNGQSGTIDPYGRVLASVDYFGHDRASMVAYAPERGVGTIYGRVGDVFAWLCLAFVAGSVVLVGWASGRRRRSRAAP